MSNPPPPLAQEVKTTWIPKLVKKVDQNAVRETVQSKCQTMRNQRVFQSDSKSSYLHRSFLHVAEKCRDRGGERGAAV